MRKEPGGAVREVRCDTSLAQSEEEREGSILDYENLSRVLRNH